MESKVCSSCHKELPLKDFIGNNGKETKTCNKCKSYVRKSVIKHKERVIAYYEDNRENLLRRNKEYHQKHREEISSYFKEYRASHRELLRERSKKYYETHREQILERQRVSGKSRAWAMAHKEEVKKWREDNKESIKAKGKEYRASLPLWYIKIQLERQGFSEEDITPELIELKRAQLKLNKLIKSYENETN